MKLAKRIALVTGGARRLGRDIALGLARAGADVAISHHTSAEDAARTADEIRALGRRALAVECDVREDEQVRSLVERATLELGHVDVLVASAGIFFRTPMAELQEADWDAHIDINLKGAFLCAHHVGLQMSQRGGCMVLIADVAGMRPWPNYLPYSVSKAGVIALTRGLAVQLAPRVRVNAVAPGPVLLPENYGAEATERAIARTLLHRVGSPADVTDAVLYLASADYVTGVVLPVDGGRHLG